MAKYQNLVQFTLDDGLQFMEGKNKSPVVNLFKMYHSRGYEFRCWSCGVVANAFMVRIVNSTGLEEFILANVTDAVVTQFTRDHVVPSAVGGPNEIKNYRPACHFCNNRRGTRMTEDEILFAQCEYGMLNMRKDVLATQIHIVPYHRYNGKSKAQSTVKINLSWQEIYAKIAPHMHKQEYAHG
jgi:hypothetical protein